MSLWPFGKKNAEPIDSNINNTFRFKQTEEGLETFFQMQCKFGHIDIQVGKGVVAVVLDASLVAPGAPAVRIDPDGKQKALLKVASDDGGFTVLATTLSGKGDRLAPGDVVIWVPYSYAEEVGKASPDRRFGWVGMIRAKVDWEWAATKDSQFKIICRYDP